MQPANTLGDLRPEVGQRNAVSSYRSQHIATTDHFSSWGGSTPFLFILLALQL